MFADRVRIFIKSGKGGDGHVSFRRELYVPAGGPDGGNGGHGGDIIFMVDKGLNTLGDFRHNSKYIAESGEEGGKRRCTGKDGEDLIIKVPEGTVIYDDESGKVIADMSGGYTMYRPTEDKSFMSKTEMEENIVSLLGGRVAEALILNDISTGASNDIERATGIARSMVTKYGMSDRIGALMLGSNQEQVFLGRDIAQGREYSEETAAIIDEETKRIVDTGYNRAKQILSDNIDKLHQVAGILLEKEKIEADEFEAIFGKE